MKKSQGRIFTTHTGSLPRPDELVQLLAAVARGESVDQSALERLADASTLEVIRKQAAAGVDVINSGEQSRVSFSTYVTQRMTGFGGSWTRRGHKDQNEFPGIARPRVVQLMRDVPQCTGPVEYQRTDLAERELDGLVNGVQAAAAGQQDLFMSAASPGIIALTMGNAHYASHEEYVMALAEEMRKEYEIITDRGVVLQLDCPDLAMERHVAYQDDPTDLFQEVVALHIAAINHAIRNIPREQVRLHVCWGNTAAPCLRPSSTLLDLPVCVATAHSIQFRKPGYPPHSNWLLPTDLLTNRIAQINTKHTQTTVWNGHATHFPIQFSRFRNCPAKAEAGGSNTARTTDLGEGKTQGI